VTLTLEDGPIKPLTPDSEQNEVRIQGAVRTNAKGERLVTLRRPSGMQGVLASYHVPPLASPDFAAFEVAVTALAESESIVSEMRTIYRRRRDTLCDIVEQAATLRVLRPASGMFALIDIRRTGMTRMTFRA
jgi:DNA-binding transcriptional MocR family regulator